MTLQTFEADDEGSGSDDDDGPEDGDVVETDEDNKIYSPTLSPCLSC